MPDRRADMIVKSVSILCDGDRCDMAIDGHAGVTVAELRRSARLDGWTCGKSDLCPGCASDAASPREQTQ